MDYDELFENTDIANIHCLDGLLQIPSNRINVDQGASLNARQMGYNDDTFLLTQKYHTGCYTIKHKIKYTDYYFYDYTKESFMKNFYNIQTEE